MASSARLPGYPLVKISQTDDLDAIKEMDQACFCGEDLPDLETAIWWIAHEGPNELGYAGALHDVDTNDLFLNRAGVLPEARGHGLQRKLIRARVRYARAHLMRSCYTYTVPFNVASSNNLIKCGFILWRPACPWACLLYTSDAADERSS